MRCIVSVSLLVLLGACATTEPTPQTESAVTDGDVKAFAGVDLSLVRAIRAAEALTSGEAYAAAFDAAGPAPTYVVVIMKDGQVEEVEVDPHGGQAKVTGTNEDPDTDSAPNAVLFSPATNLVAAVEYAEKATGTGRAIDADLFDDAAGVRYHVGVVKDGALQRLSLDPATFQALAQAQTP